MELEQYFILKVMNDHQMYLLEKRIYEKLEPTKCTLKLVNSFTFEFPEVDEHNQKEKQFYLVFESFKQNLLQFLSMRSIGNPEQ